MPNPSDIHGILFDKDGTLIDFNRTWFGIIMALARQASSDEAGARHLVALGGYDWQLGRFVGGSVVAAGTVADLVDLWHPGLDTGQRHGRIADYDRFVVADGARRAAGIAGLGPTLEVLAQRGYRLGIATNDSEAGGRATAQALGIAERFVAIIGYDSVPRPKPFPDQLALFAATIATSPSAIAMVGDNTHDLEMAHAAGAGLAIGVLSGNSTRAELSGLAHIIVDSIADLPGIFGGA